MAERIRIDHGSFESVRRKLEQWKVPKTMKSELLCFSGRFGSCFFGMTKDETLTAAEGSNSSEVIIKHCRSFACNDDVTRYWGVTPDNV